MATQKVAGEQDVVLLDVGEHRIRPVQVWRGDKGQGLAAQVDLLAVLDLVDIQVAAVGDVAQGVCARNRGNQLGVRHQLKELIHRAGVVRLIVVHHDVIDLLRVADLLDVLHILLEEALVAGLDQRGLFAAAHDVRVVGGAGIGLHHNIKNTHVGVLNPNRIDPIGKFYSGHRSSSFLFSLFADLIIPRGYIIVKGQN